MTRTVYYTATTLDGYIADEKDSLDWLFTQDIDSSGPNGYEAFIADIGSVVMGRTTYEWVRRRLVAASEEWPYTMPAWVLTHAELPGIPGADIRFAHGEVAPLHRTMADAASGQDVWVVGGGDLAAQFANAGLLDEVIVFIAPVTLGAGRPLFPSRFNLELTNVVRNRDFVCATYAVGGPLDATTAAQDGG